VVPAVSSRWRTSERYIPPNTDAASSQGQRLQLGLSGPQTPAPLPQQLLQSQQQLFCGGQGGQKPPGQLPPGQPPPGHEPPGHGQGGQNPPPPDQPPGQLPPGQLPPGQLPPGHGQGGQKKPPLPPPLWHCCLKIPVPPGQKQLPKPPLPPKPQEGKPVELHAIYHLPFLA